ncbi:PREDICTED: uncharacterized protein LOC104608508 [Nelumbo nucifera]|uniref:Uncharacterized protein LOC104608508 n=2 Tax=Nelumbo nucifera TaxID=4432 RepID=A0A1U8AXM1_NELNU|nr:PREDICTED: uncharacterized protein LOC104608508 [Nelumbo nucifera]DAD41521.1 TPA_asm: hypothetical protein HUJ06_015844 [Nelumbo nucifera]
MFNPFICGSFHHQQVEEDEDDSYVVVPSSTPRKTRRSSSFCRSNHKNKNPYSKRGLDKFSTLLEDLQGRREKIYAQMGSQDIPVVRFVYSNTNDWVPIVVKLRNPKQDKLKLVAAKNDDKPVSKQNSEALVKSPHPVEPSANPREVPEQPSRQEATDHRRAKKDTRCFSWSLEIDRWRRPSYYLPIVIILILLCLMFGRSFAIICASLLWYLVPTITDRHSNLRRSMKKKDYVRKLSEKKIISDGSPSSPKIKHFGVMKESSPRKHRHGKS